MPLDFLALIFCTTENFRKIDSIYKLTITDLHVIYNVITLLKLSDSNLNFVYFFSWFSRKKSPLD